jgi:hypothetical protein
MYHKLERIAACLIHISFTNFAAVKPYVAILDCQPLHRRMHFAAYCLCADNLTVVIMLFLSSFRAQNTQTLTHINQYLPVIVSVTDVSTLSSGY